MKRWPVFGGIVLALLIAVTAFVFPTLIVYLRSPEHIEAYLKNQTPLGSGQGFVVDWLASRGIHAAIHDARIPAHSDYPLTRIGGAAFAHETVATDRTPLHVSVEAFYIFDDQRRLVDVQVRKTIDGP